jgi:hypothetical protein
VGGDEPGGDRHAVIILALVVVMGVLAWVIWDAVT